MTKGMLLVLAATLACGAGAAQAQAPVADFFSTTSTLDGQPLAAGTVIEAWDSDGIRCGYAGCPVTISGAPGRRFCEVPRLVRPWGSCQEEGP